MQFIQVIFKIWVPASREVPCLVTEIRKTGTHNCEKQKSTLLFSHSCHAF